MSVAQAVTTNTPRLPWRTRVAMFMRLLAVQASWNYELMLGPGIGFCTEPALRLLPGGRGGAAYQAILPTHLYSCPTSSAGAQVSYVRCQDQTIKASNRSMMLFLPYSLTAQACH